MFIILHSLVIDLACTLFFLLFNLSRIAKDPRFERLPCVHKGTYADDCLVDRVTQVQVLTSRLSPFRKRQRLLIYVFFPLFHHASFKGISYAL